MSLLIECCLRNRDAITGKVRLLQLAASGGHVDIVRLLLSHGKEGLEAALSECLLHPAKKSGANIATVSLEEYTALYSFGMRF